MTVLGCKLKNFTNDKEISAVLFQTPQRGYLPEVVSSFRTNFLENHCSILLRQPKFLDFLAKWLGLPKSLEAIQWVARTFL